LKKALLQTVLLLSLLSGAYAEETLQMTSIAKETIMVELDGIGEVMLIETPEPEQIETAQLVLRKPGGMREIIDSYDGLLPAELRKFDLDADNQAEIIALLKHPDGIDVMPYIYRTDETFSRVFPSENKQQPSAIICKEVVLSTNEKSPLLCAKNIVSFHEFGPPDLYRLEFYRLDRDGLELFDKGFTNGNHFNILMNRGAFAFNEGNYLEAIDFYNQAISSSTGEITTKAFIEAIFYLAESRKFTKDFKGALELYEKIVLEFGQNARTNLAQEGIELISGNLDNIEELSFLIDVATLVNSNRWQEALALLESHPVARDSNTLKDRFLFMKAEILTAQNRIDEAIKVFIQIKEDFPESPLYEEATSLLQDIQEDPEETGGL
jgi:tetratricopeptide (TPR) repeat protein